MSIDGGVSQVKVIPEPIFIGGGLDIMSPPFQMRPGTCRIAQNFEASIYGGYRRIAGYERVDGQAAPSAATYYIMAATFSGSAAVGDTVTGGTSGATGTVIALTATSFVITQLVGTFVSAENLDCGSGVIAVSTSTAIIASAATALLHATYNNLAADVYRALIGAVPGSGSILGVFAYKDRIWAFRNNVGGTAAVLYGSSASGWSAITFGKELSFTSGGAYEIAEADTITGATSGATAVVTRVALQSGSWAAGTAAGILVITSQTGTFQAEELNVGASLAVATIAGNSAAITLLPGGRYELVEANFSGSTATKRIYGCDGVNRAFEFDGTVFVPIATGMAADTPTHIAFHKYHMFLSFLGSVQFSSAGFPYQWSPITGSGELAMGDDVTGFSAQPAGVTTAALAVFTTGRVSILYGTGASDFELLPQKDEIGAVSSTIQSMSEPVFLDMQGLTDLPTTQEYGNFAHSVLSNLIKSTLTSWRPLAVSSTISRGLSQYRIFFTNGYGLYVTMIGRKVLGILPVYFPNIVRCCAQASNSSGVEVSYFGSDDGYIYQFDKGTSFDGDSIEAFIHLAYNFSGSPRTLKRYRPGALEVTGTGYASFSFGYSLGYGSVNIIQPDLSTLDASFGSVYWDSFVWDSFIWDAATIGPVTFDMVGEAENVSLSIVSSGDYLEPFTVTGGVLHTSPRREMR